ncbi:MAG TPA: hypothetical protein H9844_07330 [Candidatus Evtepia faecigallinarum]|nr:hypothetical protein [Candidatus Evtepia faecigallinarum]
MHSNDKRPIKDERDRQIDTAARSHALDFVVAATQVLTVLCAVKGNPAWKGSLSLLFLGGAAMLFYKYDQYEERPYRQVGVALGLIGLALLIWFGITG